MKYQDGEIIGINPDGSLIQWDAGKQETYTSGETLEEFGPDNLTAQEARRLYDALPTSVTPEEFKAGHGNWGLTEIEFKRATLLTKIIFRGF